MYHIFFIHSSVNGHLGCFYVLAIVNSAAVNIRVRASSLIMVFSRYMPRSGIAGSYDSSIFSFLVVVPIHIPDHAHFKGEMLKGILWLITEHIWKSKSIAKSPLVTGTVGISACPCQCTQGVHKCPEWALYQHM